MDRAWLPECIRRASPQSIKLTTASFTVFFGAIVLCGRRSRVTSRSSAVLINVVALWRSGPEPGTAGSFGADGVAFGAGLHGEGRRRGGGLWGARRLAGSPPSLLDAARLMAPASPREHRTLLVTVTNRGFLPYTVNLHASLQRIGIGSDLLVVTPDVGTAEDLAKEFGMSTATYLREDVSAPDSRESFMSPGWSKLVFIKVDVMSQLLRAGYSVVLIDSDTVVLRDPRPRLWWLLEGPNSDVDMMIQQDHAVLQEHYLCTGFMFVRPTPRSLQLFNTAGLNPDAFSNDQIYLNDRMRALRVNFLPLPRLQFPNGYTFYSAMEAGEHGTREVEGAYIVHFNYVVGDEKMRRMRQYGMLFAEVGSSPPVVPPQV